MPRTMPTDQPATSRRPLFIFLALSGLATILAIVLSITLAFRFIVQDVNFRIPLQDNPSQQISIIANFLSVDANAGTVTIDWYPLHSDCNLPEIVANIFFDPNLLAPADGGDDDDVPSSAQPEKATFQFNSTTRCKPSVRDSFATFRTTSKLISTPTSDVSTLSSSSLQAYPFDTYSAQISIFAQLDSTNETVGMNFERPFGAPVNFNVRLGSSSNVADGLLMTLEITRSRAVQVLAVVIVLANWIVSLAVLFITAACMVWPGEAMVAELIALPIGALFAFTTVRANLPGAPEGFGAFIDFVGILPNLAVITLCGAILLVTVLVRRIRNELLRRAAVDDDEGDAYSSRKHPQQGNSGVEAATTQQSPLDGELQDTKKAADEKTAI